MSHVFITGSTDGLGLAAGRALIADGHDVVFHARSSERAKAVSGLLPPGVAIVIGDLSKAADVKSIAAHVNRIGRMDAVIHNAGIYLQNSREDTAEGHAKTLAVNTLAPYMLTALIERPNRLVYLSSGMHMSGSGSLQDIDWKARKWNASKAYSETKLHVAALAAAIARRWPKVLSNAVDPGWVPTKMGGPGASDDLEMGHLTQAWLAVSDDAGAKVSGFYWHHRQRREAASEVTDTRFLDQLIDKLAELTGIQLS